ncbi:MAG: cytochrome P450 [Gammaproteobacteria bacterium]
MNQLLNIPRPPGKFLSGNLAEFKPNPLACMSRWHRDYGDIVQFRLGPQNFYLMSHPALVEQALIEKADIFDKMYDPDKPKGLTLLLGQGLLTSKGRLWQQQRRLLQPVFQRRSIQSMLPQMVAAGNSLIDNWQNLPANAIVDISDAMMRLALEVLTRTMFSTSVLAQVDTIAPALDGCLRYAADTTMNPFLPPLFVPTRANRAFIRARTTLDRIIFGMIAERRRSDKTYDDLLNLLLQANDPETGQKMSEQQLRDEMITIFSAGHETTANLMTWTFFLLAKNPDIAAKLRNELDRVLSGKTPGHEDLDRLIYTKAVLSEALRFRPPAGVLIRRLNTDTVVQNYALKSGSLAMMSIYNIHHHPALWEKPELFNPDRFLEAKHSKYSFIPFGTGSRFCIGNHFALLETTLLLAMIAQRFDFELVSEQAPEMEIVVTIRPKGGMKLKINPL